MISISKRGIEGTLTDIILYNISNEYNRKYRIFSVYGNDINNKKIEELYYYLEYSKFLYINDINLTGKNLRELLLIISKIKLHKQDGNLKIVLNLQSQENNNMSILKKYIKESGFKFVVLDDYTKQPSVRLLKFLKNIIIKSNNLIPIMKNINALSKDCLEFKNNYINLKMLVSFSNISSHQLSYNLSKGIIDNGMLELSKNLFLNYKKHIKKLIDNESIMIDTNAILSINEWLGLLPVLFKKKYYIICMIKPKPTDSYIEIFSLTEDVNKIHLQYKNSSEMNREVFDKCLIYSMKKDSVINTTEKVYDYMIKNISEIISIIK